MRLRFRPWQLALLVIALCVAGLGGAWWYRSRGLATPAELLACLPRGEATLVYVNVAALRDSHLLDLIAGSRAAEELEYQRFVDRSGFDYRRDLDGVAAAFLHDDVYLALRGRFHWSKLMAYVTSQRGKCNNSFCRVPSSRPQRLISFYPLRAATMAMAVSADEWAATGIAVRRVGVPDLDPPLQPVWISVPGATLRDWKDLPAGAQSYVSALGAARRLVFAIGAQGDRLEAQADVECESPAAATALAGKLTEVTDLLKKMLARENKTANPADLSGVLVAGSFRTEGTSVKARWPIERAFVETIAGGPAR